MWCCLLKGYSIEGLNSALQDNNYDMETAQSNCLGGVRYQFLRNTELNMRLVSRQIGTVRLSTSLRPSLAKTARFKLVLSPPIGYARPVDFNSGTTKEELALRHISGCLASQNEARFDQTSFLSANSSILLLVPIICGSGSRRTDASSFQQYPQMAAKRACGIQQRAEQEGRLSKR